MKRRLQDPAMAAMSLSLTGEEAVAEQLSRALEAAALGEVFLLCYQHVADKGRVADEEGALSGETEVDHVAVGPRQIRNDSERIAARKKQRSHEPARWTRCSCC